MKTNNTYLLKLIIALALTQLVLTVNLYECVSQSF
jgi:hypothetical protein